MQPLSSINTNSYGNYTVNGNLKPVFPPELTRKYPVDTVSFQTCPTQNGMSKKTKWVIGLGLAAAAAGIIYCVAKGKFSKAKQLAEHIDFKPAKTIEEAADFARINLGVKKFKVQNLDLANYSNEAMVQASNTMKGKIKLPTKVVEKVLEDGTYAQECTNLLGKSKIEYNSAFFKDPLIYIDKDKMAACIKNRDVFTSQQTKNLLEKYINGTLSYKDKISLGQLAETISASCASKSLSKAVKLSPPSPFGHVYHELGHVNHRANIGLIKYVTIPQFEKYIGEKEIPPMLKEHLKLKDKIWDDVSWYASADPAEFVAEMFAGKIAGKNYSQELMDLYAKYGGPAIG